MIKLHLVMQWWDHHGGKTLVGAFNLCGDEFQGPAVNVRLKFKTITCLQNNASGKNALGNK